LKKYAIFTDVSLNPKLKFGLGAYVILPSSILELAKGSIKETDITNKLNFKEFKNTSSTKLEVDTVLWALESFIEEINEKSNIGLKLYTDSQCVAGLLGRRNRLESKNFISKSTKELLKHAELYQRFYGYHDELKFEVIKVAGHMPYGLHDTIHRIFSFIDKEVRRKFKDYTKENK
jgi:ribonuclease HI